MTTECDLLVIGGGPAGLSAAINGSSEGLNVCLIDSGSVLGGQARESSAIENYPGFPAGITGDELMGRFVEQAGKFTTKMYAPLAAARLHVDDNRLIVLTEDYQEFASRAVILTLGLNYRRLNVPGIGQLMGRGVYYGMPNFVQCHGCNVGVVGGANSAAQAALFLARDTATQVSMFVRTKVHMQMSTYLEERIRKCPNIHIFEDTELVDVGEQSKMKLTGAKDNHGTVHALDYLFIFIGALPRTLWLDGCLDMSAKKFVLTGPLVIPSHNARIVLPFETSIPGVFAAGDVREGSTKRIAAAIGEGSAALAMTHQYLNGNNHG